MADLDQLWPEPLRRMPDGTVKQINPFSGTSVWTVPGRGNRPLRPVSYTHLDVYKRQATTRPRRPSNGQMSSTSVVPAAAALAA